MNTDDISKMWAGDSPIDETNLVGESKRIPQLHSKYYNLYFREVLRVKKLKAEYKELEMEKRHYYDGSMDEQTLKEHGWKPFQLKVLLPNKNMVDENISFTHFLEEKAP